MFTARFARGAESAEDVFMLFSGERPENNNYRSLREKQFKVFFIRQDCDLLFPVLSTGNNNLRSLRLPAFSAPRAKRAVSSHVSKDIGTELMTLGTYLQWIHAQHIYDIR
jgi:hypothetical protein